MSAFLVVPTPKERELFKHCAGVYGNPISVWNGDIPASVPGVSSPQKAWEKVGIPLCYEMAQHFRAPVIIIKKIIRIPALRIGVTIGADSILEVDPALYVQSMGVENLLGAVNAIGNNQAFLDHTIYRCVPNSRGCNTSTFSVSGRLLPTGRNATFDIIDTIFEPTCTYSAGILEGAPEFVGVPSARYRAALFTEVIKCR